MSKIIMILTVLSFLNGDSWAVEPKWQEISREITNVRAVLISPEQQGIIYLGADKGVFKSKDGGNSWQRVLTLGGDNHKVNYLKFDSQDEKTIYAATGSGLFFSRNQGQTWKRIFKGKNSLENDCVTVAALPSGIYLGTKSGLFISKDKGCSWHKAQGKPGNSQIFNIAYCSKQKDYLYLSCTDGVFKSVDRGASWERIFIAHSVENGPEQEEEIDDQDEEARFSEVKYIAIDPNKPDELCLATSFGVYRSKNQGASWDRLAQYGLLSRDTKFLLFSDKSELYTITKSGIFAYKDSGWRELSFNLGVRTINHLGLDKSAQLYACTDKGLFKSGLEFMEKFSAGLDIIAVYSKGEPGIGEVQREAIKYAEVNPDKIITWRNQARKKAILPQVSIGLDRNSGDLWHWETGSSTKCDDDNLRRGRDNLDWDVRLSWDLSELIWNNDQTSIDVRSRLLAQLRGDILDEVNKLYFERIREKMEMDGLQIEDRKKRFEKELHIRELTASLDGLTGGYFSSQIK